MDEFSWFKQNFSPNCEQRELDGKEIAIQKLAIQILTIEIHLSILYYYAMIHGVCRIETAAFFHCNDHGHNVK